MLRQKLCLLLIFLLERLAGPANAQLDNRTVINTLVVCSSNDSSRFDLEYYRFAMDYVNRRLTKLNFNFRLTVEFQCALQELQGSAVRKFIDGYLKEPNKAIVFGPTYANQAVVLANVAKYYYQPQIAANVNSPELSDKFFYPYFSRVGVSDALYLQGVLQIISKFGWTSVGLLASDYDAVYSIATQFVAQMSRYNVSLAARGTYKTDPTDELLRMKSMDVRIFVVVRAANVETSIKFECLINSLGLVGPKYFWIQLGVTRTFFPPPPDNSCTVADVTRGAENSLYFTSDLLVYGNETGMGDITSGDLFSNLFETYPYLPRDGSLSINTMGLRMDAVLTAAMALNQTLKRFNYSTALDLDYSDFKNDLLNSIRAVDFQGLTGRVKLDANGDRLANAIVYQIRSLVGVPVGVIDTYLNQINWTQSLKFAGGSPPRDRPRQVINQQTVSVTSAAIILALCAIGVCLTSGSMAATHHFRHLKLIKLSSPNINNLMGAGCLCCFASCVVAAIGGCWQRSAALCWLQSSTLCLGYSIAYGAMLAKTWRVHAIFTSKNLRRVAIKDRHLVAGVAVLAVIDLAIFVTWGVVDPMSIATVQFAAVESILSGTVEVNQVMACNCNYSVVWTCVFFAYKGFLLLFGIFFAWETRAVHVESLNDSKKIGVCVYNTMVMGALGVVLSFVLPNSEVNLRFLLINLCIIVCCSTAVVIVFGSKILALIVHGPVKVDDMSNSLPGNDSIVIRVGNQPTSSGVATGAV